MRRIALLLLVGFSALAAACAEIPTSRSSLTAERTSLAGRPAARALVGREFDYAVRGGDSLTGIGARFGTLREDEGIPTPVGVASDL